MYITKSKPNKKEIPTIAIAKYINVVLLTVVVISNLAGNVWSVKQANMTTIVEAMEPSDTNPTELPDRSVTECINLLSPTRRRREPTAIEQG